MQGRDRVNFRSHLHTFQWDKYVVEWLDQPFFLSRFAFSLVLNLKLDAQTLPSSQLLSYFQGLPAGCIWALPLFFSSFSIRLSMSSWAMNQVLSRDVSTTFLCRVRADFHWNPEYLIVRSHSRQCVPTTVDSLPFPSPLAILPIEL